jgi:hypothetical protein
MKDTRVIQLCGVDGQNVGLYGVSHKSGIDAQKAFDKAFEVASKAEFAGFIDFGDNIDLMDIVHEELIKVGIVRIFAEEVTTDLV